MFGSDYLETARAYARVVGSAVSAVETVEAVEAVEAEGWFRVKLWGAVLRFGSREGAKSSKRGLTQCV